MGVNQVTSHSKYLGLPLCVGHKKTEIFQYLVERTWHKGLGWKTKFLSAAGKEILIKSVLQALPQYVMMCWKLPISLCKCISNIISKFWWSSSGKRGIHWANKRLLTKAKLEGAWISGIYQ